MARLLRLPAGISEREYASAMQKIPTTKIMAVRRLLDKHGAAVVPPLKEYGLKAVTMIEAHDSDGILALANHGDYAFWLKQKFGGPAIKVLSVLNAGELVTLKTAFPNQNIDRIEFVAMGNIIMQNGPAKFKALMKNPRQLHQAITKAITGRL